MSKGISDRDIWLCFAKRSFIFVVLVFPVAELVFPVAGLVCPTAEAATSLSVDKIRASSTLTDADLTALRTFVTQQCNELVLAKDVTEASQAAKELVENTQSSSNVTSTKTSYSNIYSRAVKDGYAQALEHARKKQQSKDPAEQAIGRHISLSIAIVMAKCDNLVLADDLVRLLKDPSEEIQYWAAKGLAGPNLHSALTSNNDNAALIQSILQGLKNCLGNTNSELVISQIALAAGLLDDTKSVAILEQCVAKRIDRYLRWDVINESTDMVLLMQILDILDNDTLYDNEDARTKLLQLAFDLYTLAYQRYAKSIQYLDTDGKTPLNLLQEQNQHALESLLIECQKRIDTLAKSRERVQITGPRFQSAIQSETSKANNLDKTWKALLGADGITDKAWKITSTIQLPDPPEEVVDRARNFRDIRNHLIEE